MVYSLSSACYPSLKSKKSTLIHIYWRQKKNGRVTCRSTADCSSTVCLCQNVHNFPSTNSTSTPSFVFLFILVSFSVKVEVACVEVRCRVVVGCCLLVCIFRNILRFRSVFVKWSCFVILCSHELRFNLGEFVSVAILIFYNLYIFTVTMANIINFVLNFYFGAPCINSNDFQSKWLCGCGMVSPVVHSVNTCWRSRDHGFKYDRRRNCEISWWQKGQLEFEALNNFILGW